jgi:dTMP kinase
VNKRSVFITLEGTDGVGKTTQARLLKSWFEKLGRSVILTREPGGGPISEKIRDILLSPRTEIENLTELFLYEAARIEHVEKVIRPALKKKKVVICDRYTDATVAYQGFARKLNLKTIMDLNKVATQGLTPDLTIWLDHPPKVALKKAQAKKKKGGDRLENQGTRFQELVRRGYQHLARTESDRVVRIPIQEKIETTQERIRQVIASKVR